MLPRPSASGDSIRAPTSTRRKLASLCRVVAGSRVWPAMTAPATSPWAAGAALAKKSTWSMSPGWMIPWPAPTWNNIGTRIPSTE
jgi:hypothetical protein